jgi:beta-galactosidase
MNFWNEPCYGGTWNQGSQYADYSKWGLADWRKELQGKYPDIQQLNQAFGTTFENWEAVQPPHQPDQFGRKYWLAWMEYGQRYFAGFFNSERELIKGVAPNLMLANKKQTNLWDQSTASSGTNWKLLGESEDVFGMDMYTGSPFLSRTIIDGACSYAEGKPVMLFEVNTVPANAAARTPDVIRTVLWAPLAGGVRGMFIWGLVNDPESGLLNDQAVSPEARAEYARLIHNISIHQREFASPRLQGKIGVLYSTTGALQYGKDTIPNYAMGAFDLFRNSHFQVDFIPEEDLNDTKLSEYRLVVLPSYCILRDAGKEAVGKYLHNGGRILCFADALTMDENLVPTPLPDWLGINAPKPAIGDHSNQRIGKTDEKLTAYLEDEVQISGVELISAMDNPQQNLIPGAQIKAKTTGDVLAYNSDSYPAIVATNDDRVVYCAFHSAYSSSLRGLMEGIARNVFGLRQEVRLVGVQSQFTDSSLITGVRSDYKDPQYRYLLVINTQFRPRTIKFELEESWRVEKELLHPEKNVPALDTYEFAPREVYLFTLTDHKQ